MRATCPCGRAVRVEDGAAGVTCPTCGRPFRVRTRSETATSRQARASAESAAPQVSEGRGFASSGSHAGRRLLWVYFAALSPVLVAAAVVVAWRTSAERTPTGPNGAANAQAPVSAAARLESPRRNAEATAEPGRSTPDAEAVTAPTFTAGGPKPRMVGSEVSESPNARRVSPVEAKRPVAGSRLIGAEAAIPDVLVVSADGDRSLLGLLREAAARISESGAAPATEASPSLWTRGQALARVAEITAAAGGVADVTECDKALRAAASSAAEEDRRLVLSRAGVAVAAAKAFAAVRNGNGRTAERLVAEARRAAGRPEDRQAAEVAAWAAAARGALAAGDWESASAFRQKVEGIATADGPARAAALREAALLCLEANDETGMTLLLSRHDPTGRDWKDAWKPVVVPAAAFGFEPLSLQLCRSTHAAGCTELQVALVTARAKGLDVAGARNMLERGLDEPSDAFAAACDLAATLAECGPLCDDGAAGTVRKLRTVYEGSAPLRGLRPYTLPPLAAVERLARPGPPGPPGELAAELQGTAPDRRNAAFVRLARSCLQRDDRDSAERYCRDAAGLIAAVGAPEYDDFLHAAAVGRVLGELGAARAEIRGGGPGTALLTAGLLAGIAEAVLEPAAVRRDVDALRTEGGGRLAGPWKAFWASPGAAPSVTDGAILLTASYQAWPRDPAAVAGSGRLVCVSGQRRVAAFADGGDLGIVFPADRAGLRGFVGVVTDRAIDDAVRKTALEALTAPLDSRRGSDRVTVTKGRARVAGQTWVRMTIRDGRPPQGG